MTAPTLGQVIKGARLGWGWCGFAFVRIEDAPDGWVIDVRPGDRLPRRATKDHFRVWWKGTDDVDTARGSQLVRHTVQSVIAGGLWPTEVRRILRFVVNDAGAPIASLQR